MKNLLYKEFCLAMHPVCYVFTFLFPFMILIPNYPLFIGTLYIIPIFSVLFLGANKGKQSNDLFYSALLPIRKRDIVFARMGSVMMMELTTLILMAALVPLKLFIMQAINTPSPFTTQGIVSSFAFVLIGYLFVNMIFFLMFYKSGRSIIAPTLIATFGYVIYIAIFTVVLPAVNPADGLPIIPGFYHAFIDINFGIQFVYLAIALFIYIAGNILVCIQASRELSRVDL